MEQTSFLLPNDHTHKLLEEIQPSMHWNGTDDFAAWQKTARAELTRLLGFPKLEAARTDPCFAVEFDRACPDEGFREIRFRFYSEKDVSVPCHLVIPLGADRPLPVLLAIQGHSKGMHISLRRPKYPGDENEYLNGDRDFAVQAVKEGLCSLTIEQRCLGECGGTPYGPDCQQASLRAILLGRTMIGERTWDAMRAVDMLEAHFSDLLELDKILCLGNSGGGTTTLYLAAVDERIRIAVPSCYVCRFADCVGAMPHCACNYVPDLASCFDMGEICGLIAPRDLIIVSGRDDPIFPLKGAVAAADEARRCYRGAGVPENIEHVIGNGEHRFYADDTWPVIRRMLAAL